ncbi:MAG: OmpA family protein [Flavobacteriales bacterium]|jgi:outer membrane protein OmpA-like peptidoglycan-associated protein|nr:OmpA family protein [Flavobacteriales bacterium]
MKYLFLFLVLCSTQLKGQQYDTITVFFEMDERVKFTGKELDKKLATNPIDKSVVVLGYADFVGDSEYNRKLSADRATSISNYILETKKGWSINQSAGKGELPFNGNPQKSGSAADRRVDIIFVRSTIKVRPKATIKPKKETTIPLVTNELEALEIDTSKESNIVLEGVEFIPGRHYPLTESRSRLDQLLLTMKKYPSLKVEIQGFICCDYRQFDGMDNDTQTMNLSENRAKFIYDYLIREGIDEDRLQYKGYGSSRPKIFPEVTEEDKQANRRVEIKVLR